MQINASISKLNKDGENSAQWHTKAIEMLRQLDANDLKVIRDDLEPS